MASRAENREELAGWIDWEGGLDEIMRWGLKEEHLPEGDEELLAVFRQMKPVWELYEETAYNFMRLIDEVY